MKIKNEELIFYNDYEPSKKVQARINTAEEDYKLKAPYRDILGILESEKIWSKEKAIKAENILHSIEHWDNSERLRQTSPPKGVSTIRNQLDDLQEKGLVFSYKDGRNKYYWKLQDEQVKNKYLYKIAIVFVSIIHKMRKPLCQHRLVLIGIIIYITGSMFNVAYTEGFALMITGILFFVTGLIMWYLGIPLIQYKQNLNT